MITIFELSGSDVIDFLNNQVVTELSNKFNKTQYTVICNPKGRITFSLFMHITENCTHVAVDSKLSDNFLQYVNLRRFRLDVSIKESNANLIFNKTQQNNNVHISTKKDNKTNCLNDAEFWQVMFKLGLPWITYETTESFIPQHVNLDQSNIIDFDKGCYPGQEVIARLHFLGKVKKRMQLITYHNQLAIKPGETITLSDEKIQAEICSASLYLNNSWQAQAIIRD